jgi:flavin-dependent dehydrogenase
MAPRTAIAGAGITGAYLYRLLTNQGQDVHIFDIAPETQCGISSCAWGTSRGFEELVAASGLDPQRYILRNFDHFFMDGVKLGAMLMTFDKPKLVRDLLRDGEVKSAFVDTQAYDRVIDATGVDRAFLPPIPDDLILPCVQYRVRTQYPLANRIQLGKIGYAWCFPLSKDTYHIGCGSLAKDPREVMAELGWVRDDFSSDSGHILCECTGSYRVTAPHYAMPFFSASGRVWGIGEAIGCVGPLAGDGVVPGMRSVQLLLAHWNHPEGYSNAILREFSWTLAERRIIDKLLQTQDLGLGDAWMIKRNARRMGVRVPFRKAATLMTHLV